MKLLTLLSALVLIQVCHALNIEKDKSLTGESADKITKRLLNRSKRDVVSDWRRKLYDAKRKIGDIEKKEKEAARNGKLNDEIHRLSKFLHSTPEIRKAGKSAQTQLYVIRQLLNEWINRQKVLGKEIKIEEFYKWLKDQAHQGGKSGILKKKKSKSHGHEGKSADDDESDTCPYEPVYCPPHTSKFRTFDGCCNNLVPGRTQWGCRDRAQDRMMDPDYADGVQTPRVAKDGSELPSARLISNSVFEMHSRESPINNVLFMTFGQYLDHDITHTPVSTVFNNITGKNDDINCGPDNCGLSREAGVNCFGIKIPKNDPIHTYGKCMYFVRSESSLEDNCEPGPRQVPNGISAWIDASNVYGSSKEENNELRNLAEKSRGKMLMSINPMDSSLKPLLPYEDNIDSLCSGVGDTVRCFKAGDVRRNEQVGLTSMHTLYVRLHNFIEEKLHHYNPTWEGEYLFQMTRKIVSAVWQHQVYSEYLPIVLGKENMKHFGLETKSSGHYKGYDKNVRGDILTVFSTVAFRYGHTLISENMTFADYDCNVDAYKDLSEVLFNPTTMFHCPLSRMSAIDAIMNGMMCAHAQKYDRFFSKQIKENLFTKNPPTGHGFDLAALNIQRGRDHGIKGYPAWRVQLGLDKHKSTWKFSDFKDIDQTVQKKLSELYKHPEDVDMFTAGVSEKPVRDGVVGPTFAKLIGIQFQKLKDGDRFYYENENVFTEEQLKEIRKYSLAKVFCNTLDHVKTIQPYALLQTPEGLPRNFNKHDYDYVYKNFVQYNKKVSCDDLPEPDLSVFSHGQTNKNSNSSGSSSSSKSNKSDKSSKSHKSDKSSKSHKSDKSSKSHKSDKSSKSHKSDKSSK